MKRYILLFIGLLSFHGVSHAQLFELGNELVYDSVQNITWMQDVNLAKTACDASAAGTAGAEKDLWDTFSNIQPNITTALESGRTPGQICADDGKMNWAEAGIWFITLNAQEYHGYDGWFFPDTPTTNVNDPSCTLSVSSGYGGCTGSELGHLFAKAATDGLGNVRAACGSGAIIPTYSGCFINTGPFMNTGSVDAFWSTQSFDNPDSAYYFSTNNGGQSADNKKDTFNHVWPVRSGLSLADSGDCLGDGEINIQDVICTINKVLAGP